MGQLEAKLWHSSDGDKIHSYCLYLVTEHVEHLATNFSLLSVTEFFGTVLYTCCQIIKNLHYELRYFILALLIVAVKNYINEIIVCI